MGPLTRVGLTLALFFAAVTAAWPQAWVAPAGVGTVNFIFQDTEHTGHLLEDGSLLGGYDSVSRGLLVEVDYAITDRVSIRAGVPYIGAKYRGPEPSFFALPIDDCRCWNSGVQDLSLTLRYNVLNGKVGLTPSISYGFPTHDYPFFGEAVIGRNLTELQLAVDAGARLDAISPRLSVAGRYSYAFVERVLDIPNDRSNAALSFGYQLARKSGASLDFYWQRSHGGLRSTEFVTDEQWVQFDRLLKDNSFHIGASVSHSFRRFDLFGSYTDFVDGTDTHVGRAITIGFSLPFER